MRYTTIRRRLARSAALFLLFAASCGGGGGGGGGATVAVRFTSPKQDLSAAPGAIVLIRYVDEDLAGVNDTTTSLFAIPVKTPNKTIQLTNKTPGGDGTIRTFLWDTTGVAPGPYKIEARTSDASHEVTAQAAAIVTIASIPLTIVSPVGDATIGRGGFLALVYRANYPGQDVPISFFMDHDNDLVTTSDRYPISSGVPDADGASQTVYWDATGVPTGLYRMFAVIDHGGGSVETVALPNRAIVSNVACAGRVGTVDTDLAFDVGTFPDGTSVVVGKWNGKSPVGHAFFARFAADCRLSFTREASGETDSEFHRVITWPDGSFFVTGVMNSAGVLGPGDPNQTSLPAGPFWAKYQPSGTLLFARPVPLPASATASDIEAVSSGGFLVAGSYTGTAVFTNPTIAITLNSAGGSDAFLARYDPAGQMMWVKSAGGTGNDAALRVSANADGSSVVLGTFVGQATFGPGETKQTVLTANQPADSFVARFDPGGLLTKVAGSQVPVPGTPVGSALHFAAFSDGSYLILGPLTGSSNVAIGTPEEKTLSTPGQTLFVARFSSGDTLQWAKVATDGAGSVVASDLVGFADGSVVLVGDVAGGVEFGPGERYGKTLPAGGYRARYTASGNLSFLEASEIRGQLPLSVAGFADGTILLGGDFHLSVTFGPGTAKETTLQTPSSHAWDNDAAAVKLNPDGGF